MPIKPLPVNLPPSKNVEEMGLKGFGAELIDGYIDEMGNVMRRPGLVPLCNLQTSAAIDGITWWQEEGKAVAVSNGEVHEITAADGTNAQIAAAGDDFEVGTRPIFANNKTSLYGANGGRLIKIPNTGSTQHVVDIDAPTNVTHPCILDTYLIANEVGSAKAHRAKVADPETWESNWFTAETQPDDIVAMTAANMVLKLIGKRTIERWRNDGVTPFVREYQQYVERGTIAPYSYTRCNNRDFFLDQMRQVVGLNGITPEIASRSMGKYLANFSSIVDALGDFIVIDGRPFLILTFKTAQTTLAMDLSTRFWYRWGWWDSQNSEHKHWRGNCACICPEWNKVLVGDHSNGIIYYLDESVYQDNGGTLKTLVRTAHIDHGNASVYKFCDELIFRVKRTNVAQEADIASLVCKWRDDGQTTWGRERTVALGQIGDTEFNVSLHQLGAYHTRQWEFYITDNAALTIASVNEKFDYGV
jgi:hypothetical protein